MLIVTPLTVGAAGYFVDGPDRGCWGGAGSTALAMGGAVQGVELRRVLAGRHPETGHSLLTRQPRHRRAGWDLTFAAPKSVSLLGALTPGDDGARLYDAHGAAVDDALDWLVAHACRAHRQGALVEADPVLARFEHRMSEAGDPHIHSHAILVNLAVGADGQWSPLAGSPLWPPLRPLGGLYRLALRARLADAGLAFEWRSAGRAPAGAPADGLVEIAAVPQAALGAVSARRDAVNGALSGWDDPELASRTVRRAVRGLTRAARPGPGPGVGTSTAPGGDARRPGPPEGWTGAAPWEVRLAAAGWGCAQAGLVMRAAAVRAASVRASVVRAAGAGVGATAGPQPAPVEPAVTEWLRARSSTFTGLDVVRALVAVSPEGRAPFEVDRWVAGFCADADPYADGRRWGTAAAQRDDDALVATARATRHGVVVSPTTVDAVIASHRLSAGAGDEVRRLVSGEGAVAVLGGQPGHSTLIDQAAVLAAARSAWEASGHTVGLVAPAAALRRWDALAALRPSSSSLVRPAVVVVDRADRMTSSQLQLVVDDAARSGAKVILVDGGTLPARHHPASAAMVELGLTPGSRAPGRSTGRSTGLGTGSPDPQVGAVRRAARVAAGAVSIGVGPGDAIADLVRRWATRPAAERPLLVGLGPAEVEALNRVARQRRAAEGELGGPMVRAGGRDYQAGDEVMALRQVRVVAGTRGTVSAVDAVSGEMTIYWRGRDRGENTTVVDRHDARRIGHGYAVTPARVPAGAREVLLLGDPLSVGRLGPTVGGAALVAPTAPRPPRGRLSELAARAATTAGPDPARDLAGALDQTLPQLTERLRRTMQRLHVDLPPDPGVGERLRSEQQAWDRGRAAGRPEGDLAGPGGGDHLRPGTGPGRGQLEGWFVRNRPELIALHHLEEAVALRADALARALEAEPSRHRSGRSPADPTEAGVWRAALRDASIEMDRPALRHGAGLGLR